MLVALYRRPTLIGKLIRWQTRGRVDHAAIWVGDQVIEATMPKVRTRPQNDIDRDAECYEIYGPLTEELTEDFLKKQMGKPYDLSSVARFLSRRQARREAAGKWFCSELVFAALQEGGVELFRNTQPWEVSPQLLLRSPLLRPIKNPLVTASS